MFVFCQPIFDQLKKKQQPNSIHLTQTQNIFSTNPLTFLSSALAWFVFKNLLWPHQPKKFAQPWFSHFINNTKLERMTFLSVRTASVSPRRRRRRFLFLLQLNSAREWNPEIKSKRKKRDEIKVCGICEILLSPKTVSVSTPKSRKRRQEQPPSHPTAPATFLKLHLALPLAVLFFKSGRRSNGA